MDKENFDTGIRHLEIMGGKKLESADRKEFYYTHLRKIPNHLWDAGVSNLADTFRFFFFPTIAEIGEACVPGEAEAEEMDPWTGRWKKVQTPWLQRLAPLLQPLRPSLPVVLQIPGPRDPLSEIERQLLGKPDFAGLLQGIEEKIRTANKRRITARQVNEGVSPFVRAGHVRNLLNVNTEESQAVTEYWTHERIEQRREFLHRQLAWLGHRAKAGREGQEFFEPQPEEKRDVHVKTSDERSMASGS